MIGLYFFASCGNPGTINHPPDDTTGLNTHSGNLDSNVALDKGRPVNSADSSKSAAIH